MRVQRTIQTTASPDDVYAALADVATHERWAGRDQLGVMALVGIETAPTPPATVGATWASTGRIPGHGHRWEDRSQVTVAEPSRCFEYLTESRIARRRGRPPREAAYRHRYDLEPDGDGARVTYTLTEERSVHPLLRVAVPGVRELTWATGVRYMAGRGLRNLVRVAEDRGASRGA